MRVASSKQSFESTVALKPTDAVRGRLPTISGRASIESRELHLMRSCQCNWPENSAALPLAPQKTMRCHCAGIRLEVPA